MNIKEEIDQAINSLPVNYRFLTDMVAANKQTKPKPGFFPVDVKIFNAKKVHAIPFYKPIVKYEFGKTKS